MSPKTGRPKAERPKEIRFSIRLDHETDERLQKFCSEHDISKGEAIRKAINLLLSQK